MQRRASTRYGRDDRPGRAEVDAPCTSATSVGVLPVGWVDRKVDEELGEKEERALSLAENHCAFAEPSDACVDGDVAFEHRRGVDGGSRCDGCAGLRLDEGGELSHLPAQNVVVVIALGITSDEGILARRAGEVRCAASAITVRIPGSSRRVSSRNDE
jgi:hypothetical protein